MVDDEVEVTVTVPDSEAIEESNGEATALAAGHAEGSAEAAEDAAETAEVVADIAASTANGAAGLAIETSARTSELEAIVAQQAEQLNVITTQLITLTDLTNKQAQLALANSEAAQFEPLPQEEAPESRHWLNKTVAW